MNIILAENRKDGAASAEHSFSKESVVIGRDALECDIAFDNTQFPMVSRKHAELLWDGGNWVLTDLNSTYGVFLNGERISRRTVSVGNSIQIGTDGPVLIVIWYEVHSDSVYGHEPLPQAETEKARKPPESNQLTPSQQYSQNQSFSEPSAEPKAAGRVRVEFVGESRAPVVVTQSSVWFGRDPECTVVFEGSAMVSRKHAEIRVGGGEFLIEDNDSFNGTLVNEHRISSVTPLHDGDEIRLGIGGPVVRIGLPESSAPKKSAPAEQWAAASGLSVSLRNPPDDLGSRTMVASRDKAEKYAASMRSGEPELLMSIAFDEKDSLDIGRGKGSDIHLDGLQISNRHARLLRTGNGIEIEDLNSTNGVFINGTRVARHAFRTGDAVQIGSFMLETDAHGRIDVFDTRAKTRIDAVNITTTVKGGSRGEITILDSISLSIQPNEFIGILGPSGSGKSTLMKVMNGMRPSDSGSVLVNNLDLYRHLDSLKQSIGYVPQDDIIHRELTVFRTLYFVSKLRLSRDVSASEITQIVEEVLDVTGLSESRNVWIGKLSGGQRKRVSIAVELITKPSIIFLDEPTAGLDPASAERVMKLFRQISESGRTVILTTHAMENVRLFDKIVILMGGKLVFYGKPENALAHMEAASFRELYDRLEQPVDEKVREHGESLRGQINGQTAEAWKQKFLSTPEYVRNIQKPQKDLVQSDSAGTRKKSRLGIVGGFSQWLTLSRRYLEVLLKDKLTLVILFAQAPAIALLTFLVMDANRPRDFIYFILSLVAFWFGTSIAAREIIREKAIYKRERMVNLGTLPYLASKLFVLGIIVSMQCFLLFVPLKFFDLTGLMPMPGELAGIPQFWTMLLTSAAGVSVGLFVSAVVRSQEMATSLVPLILIPQILFSGIVGVPFGIYRVVSVTMPAAWSFDTIKRFSTLDTLEPEGAKPKGKTKGLGLYESIEVENERIVEKAKQDFEDYKRLAGPGFQNDGPPRSVPDSLTAVSLNKMPDDLSRYISFLHPWMNEVLNQIVLVLMFGMTAIAALFVLRLKDN